MRGVIRHFIWDDFRDDVPATDVVLLQLIAGPIDGPGDEQFQVEICTPQALRKLLDRDGAVIGRHYLFVNNINKVLIESFLNDRLRRLDGDTWQDLAAKIGRIGRWEFET